MSTPEERAAELVTVSRSPARGSLCLELRGPGLPPVEFRHFANPALAHEAAAAARTFVAAVIREARSHATP